MASDWEPEPEPQEVFTWQEPPAPAEPVPPARPRRRPGRRAVLAVVGACAVSGIGAGVAAAATSGSSGSSNSSAGSPGSSGSSGSATPATPRPFARHGFGFGGGPMGPGMGGAIRGELVRPNGSGGWQTVDFQVGKVTSDAPYTSSISVTSSDNTTKTYLVTTNTLVDAGRDGVGNISNGDTVMIEAVVSNGTATATRINDQTRLASLRQAWGFGPPGGGPAPGDATPGT